MNIGQISDIFYKEKLLIGRIIAGYKISPPGELCIWNANVITKTHGKVWFGDLNITKDRDKLKSIANQIGETLYVLREFDARFGTEEDPIELLISRAVWSTDK